MNISVAIPTYLREQILLDTIDQILALQILPLEILVVDQTPSHDKKTEKKMNILAAEGKIRWLQLEKPSIPAAMNRALLEARAEVVLFLDDDVELISEIVAAHAAAHRDNRVALVAGQVIQSWQTVLAAEEPSFAGNRPDDPDAFLFNSGRQCLISRFMGGNFSVNRDAAIAIGGFDENFVRVAYKFEAEFADRLLDAGHQILFYPAAAIIHLKAAVGGTRSFGDHLTTLLPFHAVGRYYYLLRKKNSPLLQRGGCLLSGPFKAVATRFHLSHPWWIPATFLAECGGLVWALLLFFRGARFLRPGGQTA